MSTRFRRALREFTDFPATTTFAALWVAVYAAMAWSQGTPPASRGWLAGGISTATTHVFGDLSSLELYRGQVWRVLTATFVHYSLLHLGLNLLSLYQLGRVVEDWYGSWRFVALYAILGGVGNALAGLVRPWLPSFLPGNPWLTHSGGGSTAVFGLVTLIAVGAWRSKTRFGDYALGVAGLLLLLNVGLAAGLWWYGVNIDHYGHAGGALVGAFVGLANHALSRDPEGPSARRMGQVGVSVLAASALAQAWSDREESLGRLALEQRLRQEMVVRQRVQALGGLDLLHKAVRVRSYRGRVRPATTLFFPVPPGPFDPAGESRLIEGFLPPVIKAAIRSSLNDLGSTAVDLRSGRTAEPYRRMRALAERALERPPTPGEFHAFEESWRPVLLRAKAEVDDAVARLRTITATRKMEVRGARAQGR